MKTVAIWLGALVFGFLGGIIEQKFSNQHRTIPAGVTLSARARTFELVDRSGRVMSVWTTDQWGRPFLGFSDSKWEGRVVVGSIEQSDVVSNQAPELNAPWGIRVEAPAHAAHVALGTATDARTGKPTGFGDWK